MAVEGEDDHDFDGWFSGSAESGEGRLGYSLVQFLKPIPLWIAKGSWAIALLLVAIPVVIHGFNWFDPAGHPLSTRIVNSTFLRISYVDWYILAAVTGTFAAISVAVIRLMSARRRARTKYLSPDSISESRRFNLMGVVPYAYLHPEEDLNDPERPVGRAYQNVTANLAFLTAQGVPRSILVTSAKPAEGKSTSALAIAIGIHKLGRTVILVDGDMRRPRQHHLLATYTRGNGFSMALAGGNITENCVATQTGIYLMPAGALPPNIQTLLATRAEAVIEELLKHFDHVVIDSPPVLGMEDAPILSRFVEQTVFVVSSGQSVRGVDQALWKLMDQQESYPCIFTKHMVEGPAGGQTYSYSYSYGGGS